MLEREIATRISSRMSIILKIVELLYRDCFTLSKKDISYYLDQIIREVTECRNYIELDEMLKKKEKDTVLVDWGR